MIHIGTDQPVCTVVVTVEAAAGVLDDLVEHARSGIERHFGECDGFVGGALHVSADRAKLIQYLQWESERAYVRCRDDPKWDALVSTRRFLDAVRSGEALVDARIYRVVADSE